MKKYALPLLIILLILPTFLPLLKKGIQKMNDDMQYFRIYEMNKCVMDGQIPCHWVPDMGFGFGYPLFIYYPPGPYYLGELFHLLGFSLLDSVKLLFILGFVISSLGMFILVNTLFKNRIVSLYATLLYIYVPIRAVQVYLRGSLSEFLSMAIFPLILLFITRTVRNIGKNNIIFLGFSIAALFLTHNLMTLAFLPVMILWMIYEIFVSNKIIKVKDLFLGLIIGVGLASFYVIPLIFEFNLVHLESMTGGYFDYRQHFVNLYQLFISNHWGYGSSQLGPNDDMSLSIGIVQWISALLGFLVMLFNKKKKKVCFWLNIFLVGLTIIYLFLTHQRSSIIWENVSFMKMFQFPWRFIVIVAFLLPLISSYGLYLMSKRVKILIFIVTFVGLLGLNLRFFKPWEWRYIDDSYLIKEEFVKQQTASIFDYLPKSAILPPNYQAPTNPEIIEGKVKINEFTNGSNYQKISLTVISSDAIIRMPIFDFLGMVVKDNGNIINHNNRECRGQQYCFGQVSFKLESGDHLILVKLENSLFRIIGNGLSITTIIILMLLIYIKRWPNQKLSIS